MTVVLTMCLAGLLASSVQVTVFPIQHELPELVNSSREVTAWVMTVALLTAAVFTPLFGRLGDMYGKRRMAMACMALTTLGSTICALCGSSLTLMVVGRSLQGFAVSVIVLGMSIMREVLPRHLLIKGVSMMSATMGIGSATGLPIFALLIEHSDWHIPAAVTALIGAVSLYLINRFVPKDEGHPGGTLDVAGSVGFAIGFTALLLVVANGRFWGWTSPLSVSLVVLGVVVLLMWGLWELRVTDPIVNLHTLARPAILFINLATIGIGFSMFAINVAMPQLLALPRGAGPGLGYSMFVASLALVPQGLVMLAFTTVAAPLATRFGPRVLLITGAVIMGMAYIPTFLGVHSFWHAAMVALVQGFGLTLIFACTPTLLMHLVAPTEAGSANGINVLARNIGTTTAGALGGAILAAIVVDTPAGVAPTWEAFRAIFILASAGGFVAAVLLMFVPMRAKLQGQLHSP
jgi:MFS family permease